MSPAEAAPRGRPARELPLCALAGAPKAATTALAEALREHPEVAFSSPKEPFWYGTELGPLRHREGIETRADYDRTFGRLGVAPASARWRMDGSTLYLSSPDALRQLADDEPEGVVLCSLRDPFEVARAFHTQMVFTGFEPVDDFVAAWDLQAPRRARPEPACPVPRLLQYAEVVAFGSQLRAARELFGPERVHVVVYDDLRDDPVGELRRVAEALGIDPAGVVAPPAVNRSMVARSRLAGRLVRARPARRAAAWGKRNLPGPVVRTLNRAKTAVVRKEAPRPPIDPDAEARIRAELAEQVGLVEQLLGRTFDAWREPAVDAPADGVG